MGRLGSKLVLAQLLSELPNRNPTVERRQHRPKDEESRSGDGEDTHCVHVPDRGRREDAGLGRGLRERSRGPGDGVEVDCGGRIRERFGISEGAGETGRSAREYDTNDLA